VPPGHRAPWGAATPSSGMSLVADLVEEAGEPPGAVRGGPTLWSRGSLTQRGSGWMRQGRIW
jgi:hypothetical protein